MIAFPILGIKLGMDRPLPFTLASDQALQLVLGAKIGAASKGKRTDDEQECQGVDCHDQGECFGHAASLRVEDAP
jgi:hypothetical protein